jgi:peptidoglycan/LPS O-acetylase OafA/YrhL
MDPVSPFPAIASLLVAYATVFYLSKRFGTPHDKRRYAPIEGLRGYLAFFVFLHHACIWYFYLRTDQWHVPPSSLYTYLGRGSVALFFMITGFLYFSRLIDGRTRRIEWGRLFISRFLRIVPLYLFLIFLLLLVVAYVSHGMLNEPFPKLLNGIARWVGFTIFGTPDLNSVKHTPTIVSDVTWPLPYLLFFYFSLPLVALIVGAIPPIRYIALGIASVIGLILWHPQIYHLLSLSGGVVASLLVRYEPFRKFALRRMSSCISLGCISIAVASDPSAHGVVPLCLLLTAFAIIACGNDMFGVLVLPASRLLGELSYSIYLLHGIILYVTFNFVVSVNVSRAFSPIEHWLLVGSIIPILLCLCFITFCFIENPPLKA